MTPDLQFIRSGLGQMLVVGAILVVSAAVVGWRRAHRPLPPLPPPAFSSPGLLPKVIQRIGARLEPPIPSNVLPPLTGSLLAVPAAPTTPPPAKVLPLSLAAARPAASSALRAPFGRLIPCETVVALESNRLATPVIGLVTEDVWEDGKLVIPAGAEVHGHAALDRVRERLAVEGMWTVVCRGPRSGRARELRLSGLALDRSEDRGGGDLAATDGSAGLRGQVLRSDDWREMKLFAAAFLSSATSALQQTRTTIGVLGDSSTPLPNVRNASLAGGSAVLREYAAQLRDAIARDGFYLRIPAGKPFYLYVTQAIEADSVGNAPAANPLRVSLP